MSGVALRAFGTVLAGVALRSGIALRPLWTLRPRRDRVEAVLQRIQPAVDRGEGGADVVVAAALDDVGGRAEHTAAEAGAAAPRGDDAAALAHPRRIVGAHTVGDVHQPSLRLASNSAAGDLAPPTRQGAQYTPVRLP